jgi:hypothetical protein
VQLQAQTMPEVAQQVEEYLAARSGNGTGNGPGAASIPSWWAPGNPYSFRTDIADLLQEGPAAAAAAAAAARTNGGGVPPPPQQ